MARKLRGMLVVIPAHNEEDRILDCLEAVNHAAQRLRESRSSLPVHTVVVLDSCTDHTRQLAESFAASHDGFSAVPASFRNVGESRAYGIDYGLRQLRLQGVSCGIWIACTDADTRVPSHWLAEFAVAYLCGADAVTGTVEPDRRELAETVYRQWRNRYTLAPGHRHIHGANLGISADAYLQVGGFRPLAAHEDVELVGRLWRGGYRVEATDRLHAVTSGRLEGRLHAGFADYLSALAGSGQAAICS